jgi:hypothetical protein
VQSDLSGRQEGVRLKHSVNGNSVKMYDKQGSVLRVETTIHNPRDLRVYRGTEAEPDKKQWRPTFSCQGALFWGEACCLYCNHSLGHTFFSGIHFYNP